MNDLIRYTLDHKNTHLQILCDIDAKEAALDELTRNYSLLERHIHKDPLFLSSYEPVDTGKNAPIIVKKMAEAAQKANVGPMAAVAGAFADLIGGFLLENGAGEVIVENGGDIFMKTKKTRTIGLYAGPSRFSDKVGFRVSPAQTPIGICTSSDSVGPSISLGKSDASCIFADTAALADAVATAVGNTVKKEDDVEKGLEIVKNIKGVRGALIILKDRMGVWGQIPELIKR